MEGKKYVAVKEDLLSKPICSLDEAHLMGTRCGDCGEVYFGAAVACQQCQSENMESIDLSTRGTLWSYTVNWGRPPGDYKGPDPFEPFGVGLVELPEGIRILSPIVDCPIDDIKTGMEMELAVRELYQDNEGSSVVAFAFKPVAGKEGLR